jgi:prepilin-type N-terminal cleavage/methylation domain-containing protein
MKVMNKEQSGRSMIEMLGVLAIIGVLSVGGLAGYNMAMRRHKINKTNDQITQIYMNLRTALEEVGSYEYLADAPEAKAVSLGVIPEEMIVRNSGAVSLVSALGTPVEIKTVTVDGVAHGGFQLIFKNLPKEVATSLASEAWQSSGGNLINLTMNE